MADPFLYNIAAAAESFGCFFSSNSATDTFPNLNSCAVVLERIKSRDKKLKNLINFIWFVLINSWLV
ncbi:hypothetical protein D3C86_2250620 [compost metagenome]